MSLPWQIATVIEKEANSMLELYLEIGEKSTPLSRFGTTITKKNGQESLYTPGCIREIKNPCTGSRRIKESDEFKSIVSDYDEALKTFQDTGRDLLQKIAQLEVDTRINLLKTHLIQSITKLAGDFVLSEKTKRRLIGVESNYEMTDDILTWTIGYGYVRTFEDSKLQALKYDSLDALKNHYQETRKNLAGVRTEGNTNLTDDDKIIYTTVKAKLTELIPKMTFETWAKIKENEYLREINQVIAVREVNREQSKITEETINEITKNTDMICQSSVGKFIQEEMHKLKKEMWANFSAD